MGLVDESHCDWSIQCGAVAAACDCADLRVADFNSHALARGAFAFDQDAHELLGRAAGIAGFLEGFHSDEGLAAFVFVFIEGDCEIYAARQGVDVFAEFVAVEGHACFEPECVPRAQACGLEQCLGLCDFGIFEEQLEGHVYGACGEDRFDSILAGVAGAADDDLHDEQVLDREAVSLERGDFGTDFSDQVHHRGALDGDHGGFFGSVLDLGLPLRRGQDGLEMGEQFLAIRCVDDDHELVVIHAVDEDIVANAALLVAHQRVATLADLHIADSARTEPFEQSAGVPAGDHDAAHMGHIEDPAAGADLAVLLVDARVEHGHFPAGELDHFGVMFKMELVEGCVEQLGRLRTGRWDWRRDRISRGLNASPPRPLLPQWRKSRSEDLISARPRVEPVLEGGTVIGFGELDSDRVAQAFAVGTVPHDAVEHSRAGRCFQFEEHVTPDVHESSGDEADTGSTQVTGLAEPCALGPAVHVDFGHLGFNLVLDSRVVAMLVLGESLTVGQFPEKFRCVHFRRTHGILSISGWSRPLSGESAARRGSVSRLGHLNRLVSGSDLCVDRARNTGHGNC